MSHGIKIRELSETEVEHVCGGVHLGGVFNQLAQYLWSRSLN